MQIMAMLLEYNMRRVYAESDPESETMARLLEYNVGDRVYRECASD